MICFLALRRHWFSSFITVSGGLLSSELEVYWVSCSGLGERAGFLLGLPLACGMTLRKCIKLCCVFGLLSLMSRSVLGI